MQEHGCFHGSLLAGFSLIENLVTLFILTVGLLGLAGLQATSLRINHQAFSQHKAVSLGVNIADRMRANPEGVDGGFYSLATSPSQVATCYSTSGCTPEQMASNDIWEWNQLVEDNLPGGVGTVCADDTPADGGAEFASSTATSVATGIETLTGSHSGATTAIQSLAAQAVTLAQQAEVELQAGNTAQAASLSKQSAELSMQVLNALYPSGVDSDPVAQGLLNLAQQAISGSETATSVVSASGAQSAITAACSNTGSVFTVWVVWDSNNDGSLDSPYTFSINGDLSYRIMFEP